MLMETAPNTENVHFIDEYPELAKKVWLRRLAEQRLARLALGDQAEPVYCKVMRFERPDPDGAA